ncbi:MAG: L,D-transpeptidase family protein [Bacteroidota bacterium]
MSKNSKKKLFFLALIISIIFLYEVIVFRFYPESSLPDSIKIDKIVLTKSKRNMTLFANGKSIKTYRVSLGKTPIGAKRVQGDHKTPEGIYKINGKNGRSNFHLNLGISYPNELDKQKADSIGKPVGGDIKIHGLAPEYAYLGKFHRLKDWTDGCIAVTNSEIEELYQNIAIGTVIEIRPVV